MCGLPPLSYRLGAVGRSSVADGRRNPARMRSVGEIGGLDATKIELQPSRQALTSPNFISAFWQPRSHR